MKLRTQHGEAIMKAAAARLKRSIARSESITIYSNHDNKVVAVKSTDAYLGKDEARCFGIGYMIPSGSALSSAAEKLVDELAHDYFKLMFPESSH